MRGTPEKPLKDYWGLGVVRVKICGITNLEDACAAEDAGADALGFVFTDSPRRVSVLQAERITRSLGPWIIKVGVFVNSSPAAIERVMKRCGLDVVQLHGDERPDTARTLRSKGYRVVKALRVGAALDTKAYRAYPADAFLLDTATPGIYGGTGKKFDWKLLKRLHLSKPVIVSGGLRPGNVDRLLKDFTPYGVDVSSGVEIRPGKKNPRAIKVFIKNVKTH